MVVDFPIYGKNEGAILVGEGLSARANADNGESFVAEDVSVCHFDAAPVGASVSDAL